VVGRWSAGAILIANISSGRDYGELRRAG